MATFTPPPLRGDQRVAFFGQTGSGKSFMARYLLKVARAHGWRIVIVDPKRMWMGRGKTRQAFAEKGSASTVDHPCLVETFRPECFVQLFQPIEWDESCDSFFLAVMEAGNTIVYFDEVTQYATAFSIPRVFNILLTQGRAVNVSVWCGTQRPRGVPENIKSQSELWFIFRIKARKDRETVEGYVPVDETPELVDRPVPLRWFWYYNDAMEKPILVKPLVIKGVAKSA